MLTAKYGTSLDDDVLLGNLKPAYEIYDLYDKARRRSGGQGQGLLKQPPMNFKGNATIDAEPPKSAVAEG